MNKTKLFLTTALIIISFYTCFNKIIGSDKGIEGLWISTEETSSLFQPWAQQVALLITKESDETYAARGFFIINGESKALWKFVEVKYDGIEKRITLLDEDSDTLIFRFDEEKSILKGMVHTQEEQKQLDFIHAPRNLEVRLLYPRVPDEKGMMDYSIPKPEEINDGLKTESIYSMVSDSSVISNLIKKIIDQDYGKIKSLLILKDNKLIAEEYFYGYNREDLQKINSCTKSVTSLMLGIALDHHPEANVNQPIFNFFPQYDSLNSGGREEIKLKHILTMTSGLEWDDYPREMYQSENCFQYILSLPMESKPGDKFNYNSGGSVLLGGIIQFLENKKPLTFAEELLFAPLGIKEYVWESHNNDILRCGEGLSLRPRDMAKIGLLVLNDGMWLDKQIVPKEWIEESTKPLVKESNYFDYGYQWWFHSKNNWQWWKEPNAPSPKEHDLITALGYAGQYIMIIRHLNLVIVTTASDFEDGHIARSKIPMVIEEIVPIFEASDY